MLFMMKAEIIFEAEDLDEAFSKLSQHFDDLSSGYERELFIDGQLEIMQVIDMGRMN